MPYIGLTSNYLYDSFEFILVCLFSTRDTVDFDDNAR
ncbi:hypothetical protein EA223_28755 [Escherichia coli]|nr:hypothetical protein EA223_28755 [Escherichia coli]